MKIEWIEKYMIDAERHIGEDRLEEGMMILNALLYDEPGYGSLHNHIGWAYLYYTDDQQKAERHLKLAIHFDGIHMAPYLHLGNLYVRMQRYAEALVIFEKGLTKPNANRIAFLENIGRIHEVRKEFGKAIKTYKDALIAATGFENANLEANIKRCRKKRWVMMFTF